ncbi:MAG: response regulator, partial [Pyrinomonadaceae bacterium]|nr:response regulator [Pyrinomonadaceae bacterium]
AVSANKAKDEFLAVLSHELRTPLNAMYGWVRMLSGGQLDEKATKRAIEVIERNIQLQTKLIEDILDVSRIISGKIKLEPRNFDFVALINSIVESNRPTALMKGIEIETHFNVETLQYHGDSERLQQVLINLLNNAVKFTPGNGKITIALEKKSDVVEVSVIDNGIGIKAAFLPQVFDRFKQADGTTTRKHGGLGLGLAIVKYLTELHDGTVSAHSDGENQGAAFKIILPTENKIAREITDFAIHISNPSLQIQNIRVLLVEDDVDAREMLRVVLEAEGAVILNANTGLEALKKLNEETPDIILSDIGMPEMDGLDFIKSVRLDKQLKKIPAIALTAYASVEDRKRILETGFDDCLAKPVDFEKLKNTMNRVIRKSKV